MRYPPFPPTITSIQIASTGPDLSPTECVWDVMEWRFTYHLTNVHFKHYSETALASHKLRVLPTTVDANKSLDCEAEEENKDFLY